MTRAELIIAALIMTAIVGGYVAIGGYVLALDHPKAVEGPPAILCWSLPGSTFNSGAATVAVQPLTREEYIGLRGEYRSRSGARFLVRLEQTGERLPGGGVRIVAARMGACGVEAPPWDGAEVVP